MAFVRLWSTCRHKWPNRRKWGSWIRGPWRWCVAATCGCRWRRPGDCRGVCVLAVSTQHVGPARRRWVNDGGIGCPWRPCGSLAEHGQRVYFAAFGCACPRRRRWGQWATRHYDVWITSLTRTRRGPKAARRNDYEVYLSTRAHGKSFFCFAPHNARAAGRGCSRDLAARVRCKCGRV